MVVTYCPDQEWHPISVSVQVLGHRAVFVA